MSKKNSSSKDMGPWDRFMLWTHENQKVIWVVLLILIAPTFAMTGLFTQGMSGSGAEGVVYAKVYGQSITQGEVSRTRELLQLARSVLQGLFFSSGNEPLPGAFGAGSGRFVYAPPEAVDFFALREKARRMGVRVSDAELGEVIRDIWQRTEALDRARSDITARMPQGANDPNDYSRLSEMMELSKKKLVDLRGGDGKYFDQVKWTAMIEGTDPGRKRANLREFEAILGDLLAISKLESFVTGSVQVTPEELFKEFKKSDQARKLSWVEVKIPEDLRDKVAQSLTPEEVKTHHAQHRTEFEKEASIRTSWLFIPREHFTGEAEKLVTEADVSTYYQENKNNYRKPAVLADESAFALRKPLEKAAFEAQLYKPLEEVKDKVREKVIEERALRELNAFAQMLGQRIYPPKVGDVAKTASDYPAVNFDALVKEFSFLKSGSTAFVEKEKAKEALGDAHTATVDGWFSSMLSNRPITPPRTPLQNDKGRVFYTKPETRPRGVTPGLTEIEPEVRKALATQRLLAEVETALQEVSRNLNAAGTGDLSTVTGVEITVAGEKTRIEAAPVHASATFVARTGSVMVPAKEPEKKAEATPADPTAAKDTEPKEEAHASSMQLLAALYKLDEAEKLKTAVSTDEKAGAAYLVRFDDLQLPDPARFEDRKVALERQVRREAQETAWAEWRKGLLKEALPTG